MVQAVAAAPVRIVRPRRIAETPQRWQTALDRALENALDVLIEPVSGEAFVESACKPGTLYAVTRTTCTCPAGVAGDPVCQHRAAYRCQMGELPLEAVPVAPVRRCSWCAGAGQIEQWGVGGPIGSQTCPDCGGGGIAESLAAAA
jgi:hypothetical protein